MNMPTILPQRENGPPIQTASIREPSLAPVATAVQNMQITVCLEVNGVRPPTPSTAGPYPVPVVTTVRNRENTQTQTITAAAIPVLISCLGFLSQFPLP